mgnify:CR=1 FL=1
MFAVTPNVKRRDASGVNFTASGLSPKLASKTMYLTDANASKSSVDIVAIGKVLTLGEVAMPLVIVSG